MFQTVLAKPKLWYPPPPAGSVLYLTGYPPMGSTIYDRSEYLTGELLTNTGFETGDPPTNWTVSGANATWARSVEQVHGGTYSGKQTRNGANCAVYQDYPGFAQYGGRTVTVGCWVYATVANRAIIYLYDSSGGSTSSYHSGNPGWEYLTVTRTITVDTTNLEASLMVLNGDTSAYFDDITMHIVPNNGTTASATWTRLPSGLWVLSFDGNDYVKVLDTNSLDFGTTTDFSLLCWFKVAATASRMGLFRKGSGSGGEKWYGMSIGATTSTLIGAIDDGTNVGFPSGATAVDDNKWHLGGLTADRDGVIQLYLDGVADGASLNISAVGNIDNARDLYLGAEEDAAGSLTYYLIGRMALKRIISGVAWTAAQVANDWNQTRSLFGV